MVLPELGRPALGAKLFHHGYAVGSVDGAISTLTDKFGIRNWHVMHMPPESPGKALAFAYSGDLIIELVDVKPGLVPIYNDWIPADGSALRLHHLGHLVDSEEEFEAVSRHFHSLGVEMVVDAEMGDILRYRYFDTVPLLGHYCEFVCMKPGGAGFWEGMPRN